MVTGGVDWARVYLRREFAADIGAVFLLRLIIPAVADDEGPR